MAMMVFAAGSALAQGGGPSGRGAVTGDPAASSANPRGGYPNHRHGDPIKPERQRDLVFRW